MKWDLRYNKNRINIQEIGDNNKASFER